MAIGALELAVRAREGEAGLLEMIEDPQCPAGRRMASVALFAQSAFVHVVFLVTVDTAGLRVAEGLGAMALRAAHHIVQAEQRKARQVMVEADLAVPVLLAVAGVAALLEFQAMRVGGAMAADTVGGGFLLGGGRGMTGVAVELGMPPEQRKARLLLMVELCGLPVAGGMALAALAAALAAVDIVRGVAAHAGLGSGFVLATEMTATAADGLMGAGQAEFGLAVIEVTARPVVVVVAVSALVAELATVVVILLVAGRCSPF